MGRPSLETDEFRTALAAAGGLGVPLPALAARLAAAGHGVSQRTLARLRAREHASQAPRRTAPGRPVPPAPGEVAALEHAAAEAIDGATLTSGLDALRRNLSGVQAAIDSQILFAGSEARAAQSTARLIDTAAKLMRAIDDLTPRTDTQAAYMHALGVEAKAELMARVEKQAREDEQLRVRLHASEEARARQTALTERLLIERHERQGMR